MFDFLMGRGGILLGLLFLLKDFWEKVHKVIRTVFLVLIAVTLAATILEDLLPDIPESLGKILHMFTFDEYSVFLYTLIAFLASLAVKYILIGLVVVGNVLGFCGITGSVSALMAIGSRYADNYFTKRSYISQYDVSRIIWELSKTDWKNIYTFAVIGAVLFFLIAAVQVIIYRIKGIFS